MRVALGNVPMAIPVFDKLTTFIFCEPHCSAAIFITLDTNDEPSAPTSLSVKVATNWPFDKGVLLWVEVQLEIASAKKPNINFFNYTSL